VIYESLQLSGTVRNAERLGLYVAWLVSNSLLAESTEQSAGRAVAHLRMQALTGPEFLTTVLHGELRTDHLNALGQSFSEAYFVTGTFNEDYAGCDYTGENEWHRYDELAPKISAAFRCFREPTSKLKQGIAKILQFPSRKKKP
jgi:predicted AAA+ superfamily ATPase